MRVPAEDKEVLKQLAKLGALRDYVSTSSGELAARLEVSQQTASRKILDLLDRGLIERRMGTRKQLIRVSPPGLEVLKREAVEYQSLFAEEERWVVRGRVVTGLGEGKYYISRDGYRTAFLKLLGFEPFPGTLNVDVDALDRDKVAELKEREGHFIPEFQSEGRTFGAVKAFPAELDGIDCAVIFPVRSHHTAVMELICPFSLREKLDLKDGAAVTVRVRALP